MKTTNSLDYHDAKVAIAAVEEALIERSEGAVIAVADASGELIALLRVGNAPLPAINIARNKAWTAARDRTETKLIGNAVKDPVDSFDIAYYGDDNFVGWGGGLPVFYQNQLIGAVAVSGLEESVDIELANIGLSAIKDKLGI
ncbi:GlcG/HbpS family heme-binding protein [Agaribacter marinus]|uniref:Heme-binding protein n=1 Tax=Agaribacter marinus TaxID=1431249 RepID=A0AA37SVT6_9ALTE|nr:heme-binding protein [Agaribacter marinus]GLR69629.1 hypothetical protein GCM10007852_05370 [Agaribacter marinus]